MIPKNRTTNQEDEYHYSLDYVTLEELIDKIKSDFNHMQERLYSRFPDCNLKFEKYQINSDDESVGLSIFYSRDYTQNEIDSMNRNKLDQENYARNEIKRFLKCYPALAEEFKEKVS